MSTNLTNTEIGSFSVIHLVSTSSTQDHIKEHLSSLECFSVIVAEEQSGGRGRFNRSWASPKGGLWFSILIKDTDPDSSLLLGLCAAVSVAEVIKDLYPSIEPIMKWPNDILIDTEDQKKKLCGILTENITQGSHTHTVMGIGINVNNDPPLVLSTSLKALTGKETDLDYLLKSILSNLKTHISDPKGTITDWKRFWNPCEVKIKIFDKKKVIEGRALDINSEGHLVVEHEGKTLTISLGEVL